ncbi:hypothetical protein E4U49_000622 [Claviceps purpurea]|nr:hypothetical protein E4U49_000622 [Claviceps purpurea]
MSTNGKAFTRASSSRAASQPTTHEQLSVPQLPDAVGPQDDAPITTAMFIQQLSAQIRASEAHGQSVLQAQLCARTNGRASQTRPNTPGTS